MVSCLGFPKSRVNMFDSPRLIKNPRFYLSQLKQIRLAHSNPNSMITQTDPPKTTTSNRNSINFVRWTIVDNWKRNIYNRRVKLIFSYVIKICKRTSVIIKMREKKKGILTLLKDTIGRDLWIIWEGESVARSAIILSVLCLRRRGDAALPFLHDVDFTRGTHLIGSLRV